jgi:hypothetical protein
LVYHNKEPTLLTSSIKETIMANYDDFHLDAGVEDYLRMESEEVPDKENDVDEIEDDNETSEDDIDDDEDEENDVDDDLEE